MILMARGTYGSYAPYGSYGSYYGGRPEFGHGFGHTGIGAEGTIAHHGMGFRSIGVAHVGAFGHSIGGGFGHGMAGGFHGGGGGGHR